MFAGALCAARSDIARRDSGQSRTAVSRTSCIVEREASLTSHTLLGDAPVPRFTLFVNSETHDIDVPAGTSLLGVLRDDLSLTGTRFGCGHSGCGACYVLVGDAATPSCTIPVEDVVGKEITTIEGLAREGELHPVQRAFVDEDAMQCGYCTTGMIISSIALLARTPSPSEDEIRAALAPHLCRCGVYGRVIRAVQRAARLTSNDAAQDTVRLVVR